IKLRTSAPVEISNANETAICNQMAARRSKGVLASVLVVDAECRTGNNSAFATWRNGTSASNSNVTTESIAANEKTLQSNWKFVDVSPIATSMAGSLTSNLGKNVAIAPAIISPA